MCEVNQTWKNEYYITYMWDLKKSNSQNQRLQWWLPGAEGGGNGSWVTFNVKSKNVLGIVVLNQVALKLASFLADRVTGPEKCFITLWLDESHMLSLIGIAENHSERKPEGKKILRFIGQLKPLSRCQ